MLFVWEDLSEINLNDDKMLFEELIILTKECKNCIGKKCPGGYNCKFGVCLRENKICYNDLMYGKCYNMLMETNENNNLLYKCINGIHLSEKKLIPYNQRMLSDLTNIESNFLIKHNISFNSKNNIISLCLNDNTINIIKDIISNKLSKTEILDNLKSVNNLFINNNNNNLANENTNDDNIFDDIFQEIENENNNYIINNDIINNDIINNNIINNDIINNDIINNDIINNDIINNDIINNDIINDYVNNIINCDIDNKNIINKYINKIIVENKISTKLNQKEYIDNKNIVIYDDDTITNDYFNKNIFIDKLNI
jgi:hypothetical protein